MTRDREYMPAILLLFMVGAMLFPAFSGKTFFIRDISYLFHPWHTYASQMLQSGSLPLWNPYSYSGMPFLANWQSAVFFPFSMVFSFFRFAHALSAYYALILFAAGYFAYLFGRSIGLNRWSAACLMLCAAFNGFVLTKLEFLSYAGVLAFTFAPFLFARKPYLMGLTLAVAFLAGHQAFGFLLVMTAAYVIITSGAASVKPGWRAWAMGGLLAVLVISVQVLPSFELFTHSNRRQSGVDAQTAVTHSLAPSDLKGVVMPAPQDERSAGETMSWVHTLYFGTGAMVLALIACVGGAFVRRTGMWAGSLIVIGIVMSLGKHSVVFRTLYDLIPPMHMMRYPVQYFYFAAVGISVFAALGAEHIQRYRVIAALVVAAELAFMNHAFQPLADDSFFDVKPPLASTLQADGVNSRFILSPGMETDRHMPGAAVEDAWQRARASLYNAVSLPYRVMNAYGAGEPLTLALIEQQIDTVYKQNTPALSRPFLAEFGITRLVTRKPLPQTPGYSGNMINDLYVYQVENAQQPVSIAGGTTASLKLRELSPGVIRADATLPQPDTLVIHQPPYPGWRAYVNGIRQPIGRLFNGSAISLPAGRVMIDMVYTPLSVAVGALAALAGIIAFMLIGIYSLCVE